MISKYSSMYPSYLWISHFTNNHLLLYKIRFSSYKVQIIIPPPPSHWNYRMIMKYFNLFRRIHYESLDNFKFYWTRHYNYTTMEKTLVQNIPSLRSLFFNKINFVFLALPCIIKCCMMQQSFSFFISHYL